VIFGTPPNHTSAKMSKEDTERLQAIIDGGPLGVNLDLDISTGKLTWGCVKCGAALLAFTEPCYNGATFPGCKEDRDEL